MAMASEVGAPAQRMPAGKMDCDEALRAKPSAAAAKSGQQAQRREGAQTWECSRYDEQFFKTKLCLLWKNGSCRRRRCHFAHGEHELQKSPDLSKTAMCKAMQKNGVCDDRTCKFAHDMSELRATGKFFKTTLCSFSKDGSCKMGEQCRHAHSRAELRSADPSLDALPQAEDMESIAWQRATTSPAEMSRPPTIAEGGRWRRSVTSPAPRDFGPKTDGSMRSPMRLSELITEASAALFFRTPIVTGAGGRSRAGAVVRAIMLACVKPPAQASVRLHARARAHVARAMTWRGCSRSRRWPAPLGGGRRRLPVLSRPMSGPSCPLPDAGAVATASPAPLSGYGRCMLGPPSAEEAPGGWRCARCRSHAGPRPPAPAGPTRGWRPKGPWRDQLRGQRGASAPAFPAAWPRARMCLRRQCVGGSTKVRGGGAQPLPGYLLPMLLAATSRPRGSVFLRSAGSWLSGPPAFQPAGRGRATPSLPMSWEDSKKRRCPGRRAGGRRGGALPAGVYPR